MNAIREQLISMLDVQPRETGFSAQFQLRADFSILPDHFPGSPILPGMCMVQLVLLAAEKTLGLELRLSVLKNAKMMQPILPGETISIEGTIAAGDRSYAIKAKFSDGQNKRAEFSMITSPSPGKPPEGRGEGDCELPERVSNPNHPHPNPLPACREKGPELR